MNTEESKLRIIESIFYLYPPVEELNLSHPTFKTIQKLVSNEMRDFHSFLASPLIDDLRRPNSFPFQSKEEVLDKLNKTKFLGQEVLESSIELQYGNLGCKFFDALYHRDILFSLAFLERNWEWKIIHPVSFKSQQSGMLLNLWNMISENVYFGALSQMEKKKKETYRDEKRNDFLKHFSHVWIDLDGKIESKTYPQYKGKIIHTKI